jgi:hypothetical protein
MNAPQIKSDQPASAVQLSWPGHVADDVAATYGPEPMANLTATAEALSLSSPRGNFHLPRADVTKLGRGNLYPWFFAAVRIHHTVRALPRNLQFKPLGLSPAELRAALHELGYPVG